MFGESWAEDLAAGAPIGIQVEVVRVELLTTRHAIVITVSVDGEGHISCYTTAIDRYLEVVLKYCVSLHSIHSLL